jgi:Spy/CpxP family protein refolding chaperone
MERVDDMTEETKQKIQKIAQTYGYDAQSRQCIEEMAELTQAINKF